MDTMALVKDKKNELAYSIRGPDLLTKKKGENSKELSMKIYLCLKYSPSLK